MDIKNGIIIELTGFTRTIVVLGNFAISEDLEGWVARNSELAASLLTSFGTVNLSKSDWWVVGSHDFRGFSIFRLDLRNKSRTNVSISNDTRLQKPSAYLLAMS